MIYLFIYKLVKSQIANPFFLSLGNKRQQGRKGETTPEQRESLKHQPTKDVARQL